MRGKCFELQEQMKLEGGSGLSKVLSQQKVSY